jgi:tetratricopeptide (TPR) repeat protein
MKTRARIRSNLAIPLLAAALALPARAEEATTLDGAVEAWKAGDWEQVVEIASAVPEGADRPRAQYLAGEALLRLGRADEAADVLRSVLEARPKANVARLALAQALLATGEIEEAKTHAAQAAEAMPKDADARRVHGEVLMRAGDAKGAEKELDAAAKIAPKDPSVARARVELHLREGEADAAAKVATSLAKTQPKHPMGPFLLGWVRERQGKDEDAIEAYETAIARDETFLDAHKNLAILCHTRNPTYQDRERTQKAMKHYERYFALGGKDPELQQAYETIKAYMDQLGFGK